MDIEVFVHGVPNGQRVRGKNNDPICFQNLYNSHSEEHRFLIEVRSVEGTPHCYYHYLHHNNIYACDGRPGSYVGISLRIDHYCTDVMAMYHVLDVMYHKYLIAKYGLLTIEGDKTKFAVADFAAKENELNEFEGVVEEMIRICFNRSDFAPIPTVAPNVTANTPKVNFQDCHRKYILGLLSQSGRVVISADYPSVRESRLIQECKDIQARMQVAREQEKAQQQKLLTEKNDEILALNDTVRRLTSEGDVQKQKIANLEKTLRETRNSKKMEDLLAVIRDPLVQLSFLAGAQKKSTTTPGVGKKPFPIVKTILAVNTLLLLLLFIVLWMRTGKTLAPAVVPIPTPAIEAAQPVSADSLSDTTELHTPMQSETEKR